GGAGEPQRAPPPASDRERRVRPSHRPRLGHRRERGRAARPRGEARVNASMIIDWHTHVHSQREQAAPFWRGQCPATIDNVLRLHAEVGLDVSVISNSGHYLKDYSREEALPVIREANRYLASLRDQHKDRVIALAVAIPGAGEEHLRE